MTVTCLSRGRKRGLGAHCVKDRVKAFKISMPLEGGVAVKLWGSTNTGSSSG